ncbi:MAG: thioredoxin domain-containing protein, partial [Desulfobacteraceae bacterium]
MNKISNHLINEKSPYLIQHAYNPVDWYPWSEEAFARAEKENKPILLSIGYSTCHWCHVMEKESFTDPEVALIMNKNFICIKVDREERPDIDRIYISAVTALTGSAGWPLNVFLTPRLKPFFGGTYFPGRSKFGITSWSDLLNKITIAWNDPVT